MSEPNLSNLFDLTGRVAVVTGGAGTIGSRVCHGLAIHGAGVAVVDIDGSAAERVANEIMHEHGTQAVPIACDVASPVSVEKMVRSVTDALGDIHVLHNNAAAKSSDLDTFFAPFEDYDLATWRQVMSVNLDGMFLVAQAVGGRIVNQGTSGSIIQTSSIYGLVGPDQRIYEGSIRKGYQMSLPAAYAASKAAVIGLSRYLATYWADKKIRVNTLVPGGVDNGVNETFRGHYSSRVPLGRLATADEMIGAVVYLASDASSYVTGQELVVDGGWIAW